MAEGISDNGQRLARISQLPAHHHHQAKAEEQKEQTADAVLDADHLVIGGENVFTDEAELVVFVSVFVGMVGFGRSVRMGSGVHAKKNLPHQLLKDKARLQSRNDCHRTEPTAEGLAAASPSVNRLSSSR